VGPLDLGAAQAVREVDAHQPSRHAGEALAGHVHLERLGRRATLREDVDHVHRGAPGEGGEHRVDHALPGLAGAVEAQRGAARAAGVEAVPARPRHVHARGPAPGRRGLGRQVPVRHRAPSLGAAAGAGPRGRAGPVSIGARTAFPHSVQLPS
jgi:hypothetical protein